MEQILSTRVRFHGLMKCARWRVQRRTEEPMTLGAAAEKTIKAAGIQACFCIGFIGEQLLQHDDSAARSQVTSSPAAFWRRYV